MTEVFDQELELAQSRTKPFVEGLDRGWAATEAHFSGIAWEEMDIEAHFSAIYDNLLTESSARMADAFREANGDIEKFKVIAPGYDSEGAIAYGYGLMEAVIGAITKRRDENEKRRTATDNVVSPQLLDNELFMGDSA